MSRLFKLLIFNVICILAYDEIIDTLEFVQNNKIIAKIDIPRISYDQMLKHLFRIIDQDSNDYLNYREMEAFQRETHPNIELTVGIFKQICKHMGVNPYIGLTRMDFNRSYTLYKDELGTDIEHDYKIIKRKQYTM